MTPEEILAIKPRVLTQKQRELYFENGYILLEKFLPDSWIERLRAATDEMVDKSRSVSKSDETWDVITWRSTGAMVRWWTSTACSCVGRGMKPGR